jgi:hypothetical protein
MASRMKAMALKKTSLDVYGFKGEAIDPNVNTER